MAAPAGDGNQPQQEMVNGGDEYEGPTGPSRNPPEWHYDGAWYAFMMARFARWYADRPASFWQRFRASLPSTSQEQQQQEQAARAPPTPPPPQLEQPPAGRRRPRRSVPTVLQLILRARRLCRRVLSRLLQWFAARPLGQRALEAVGCALTTAERATIWAGSATAEHAGGQPVPFAWYLMVPVVTALMVIRTGAALAERCLGIDLPDNRELVSWLERQRIQLEQLQTVAARNIHIQCVDESDITHRFLNTWPFSIPYRTAQQLGIIPVKVEKQPSDMESTSMLEPVEPVKSSSLSELSTLTEAEELEAPSSREVTPQPENVGDRTIYFSPVEDRQTKEEMVTEEQRNDKHEETEGERAQEEKAEEPPTITAEEAERAARSVEHPEPSAPPEHLLVAEAERAAMSAIPPPPPLPSDPAASSEDLLAAEGASASEPGASSRAQKTSSKAPKASMFLSLFGAKLG